MRLKQLRDNIDEIDRQIIRLLEKRFDVVEEIAKLKKNQGLKIEDGDREADVLKNWINASSKIETKFLKRLIGSILDYSKYIQSKVNRRGRRT